MLRSRRVYAVPLPFHAVFLDEWAGHFLVRSTDGAYCEGFMDEALARLRTELAGRYEVEDELGRGGMAVVYRAKDLRHPRHVAIKVLRGDLGASGGARFAREMHTVAQLHHPHIVSLYDSGSVGGHPFYVMPYVEGETLRQKLEREGQLAVEEAVRITREVADALDFAHARGVVHRDIKPENIFLSAGHALVADFGIARGRDGAGDTLTDIGVAIGTPAYMSPEQATADPRIDGRSDQYALGCVLYEMLAGSPPFTGATSQAIMARHTSDPVPPLRTVRAVPAEVESVLVRALEKVPADRWPSMNAFAQALVSAPSGTRGERHGLRAGRLVARLAPVATAVGAVVVLFTFSRDRSARASSDVIHSVALLPFEFRGDSQWFGLAAGLSDNVYTALTRVEGLAPIGGVRTQPYVNADPRDAGKSLGVDAVVSGAVYVVGNRVRVTTEITDVGDRPVSRQEFDANLLVNGDLLDIFDLQDSLTVRILDYLQVRLSDASRAALARGVLTRDAEAYTYFLDGRRALRNLTLDGARQAVKLFDRAIARDSSFADAWAGLAEAYLTLYQLDAIRPGDVASNARAAAEKAIRLDPRNGYALSLRGALRAQYDWDWEGGLQDIRDALRVTPSSADAWFLHSVFLNVEARPESALAMMRKAVSIDRTNPFLWANLGFRFRFAGMGDSAIKAHEHSLSLDSTQWLPRMALADLLLGKGDTDRAARLASRVREAAGDSQPFILGFLATHYGRSGNVQRAREIVAQIERIAARQYVPGIYIGQARLAVGDSAGALEAVQESVKHRDLDLSWWLIESFSGFQGDARYERIRSDVFKNLNAPRQFPPVRFGPS